MISVNGIKLTPTYFPDGCQQVWKLPDEILTADKIEVLWRFDSEIELVTVMQLSHLLRFSKKQIDNLIIPYLPYARQDKEMSNELCFGLISFSGFVGIMCNPTKVTLFDPHPPKVETFFWNELVVNMPNLSVLSEPYDVVCFPDNGAKERYSPYLTGKPVIYGEKVRDQSTGHILSYELISDIDLAGKKLLVVDDIADGSKTFMILGEKLKNIGVKASLYISHGIFSCGQEGINKLKTYYEKVITTNSLTSNSSNDLNYNYNGVEVLNWMGISVPK